MIYYPPVGFHFKVTFELTSAPEADSSFQEVSGLEASMEMESIKEGGENRFVHRLPLLPTYGNLILKRGMLVDSALIKWFEDAILNYEFHPIPVSVTLLNQENKPQAAWIFHNAVPVKWSTSNLNAEESSLVVETIELSYTFMRRMPLPSETRGDLPVQRPNGELSQADRTA